jgi:outer membrane lipoprotein-sorting protein
MTSSDDLEVRLAQLRAEWPAGSMVDSVMARLPVANHKRARRTRRLSAALAASLLFAGLGLAWFILASQPRTLLAAVQDGLKRARSAHIVLTSWADGGASYKAEIWYRRDEGLRMESPEQVIVEDGKFQWSWKTPAAGGDLVVLRQRSPGFFSTQLPGMLALPDVPNDWSRTRSPELDREVNGRRCQGFTLTLANLSRQLAHEATPAGQLAIRELVLAEPEGRIHEITVQVRQGDGSWRRMREIKIEYDVPVAGDLVTVRLPEGARVVDRDQAFESLYPLDRALRRVEMGGLILAVHDLQPLVGREGFYVVSSVRGTPEFLKAYPPRRRPLNPEVVVLDVAFQPGSNMMQGGGKYDRIVMGNSSRDGVEFSWWLVVPRRFFKVKDGKRVYLPDDDRSAMAGEPGRLDDLPGAARVPLSATYWNEKLRDANGVQKDVSTWTEVPLAPNRPPATLDEVAARARHDLLMMGVGSAGGLLGVAADAKAAPKTLRPMSHFSQETVSDADFAAAVRRGFDDLRQSDEVRDLRPGDLLPPGAGEHTH